MKMWRRKRYIFNVDSVQGEMSGTFFCFCTFLCSLFLNLWYYLSCHPLPNQRRLLKRQKTNKDFSTETAKWAQRWSAGECSPMIPALEPERKLKVTWGFELKSRLDPPNLCNLTYLSQNRVRITLNPVLIVWKQTDFCRTLWNEMNGSKLSWNNTNMKTTPSVHPVQTFFLTFMELVKSNVINICLHFKRVNLFRSNKNLFCHNMIFFMKMLKKNKHFLTNSPLNVYVCEIQGFAGFQFLFVRWHLNAAS